MLTPTITLDYSGDVEQTTDPPQDLYNQVKQDDLSTLIAFQYNLQIFTVFSTAWKNANFEVYDSWKF